MIGLPSWDRRLAQLLSNGLHPFVITTLTVPLVVLLTDGNPMSAVIWTALFAGLVICPPLLLLLYQVHKGQVESIEVAIRRQRTVFYMVGLSGLLLLVMVMHLLDASNILRRAVYAAIATNAIAASVNYYVTKVSVHAAAMAGCATVLGLVSIVATEGRSLDAIGAILISVTALQGWARVRLQRHTVWQVLLGWAIAVVCVLLIVS